MISHLFCKCCLINERVVSYLITGSTVSFISICFSCDGPVFNTDLRTGSIAWPGSICLEESSVERAWEVAMSEHSAVIKTVIVMNHSSFLEAKISLVPNFNLASTLQCFSSSPSCLQNLSLCFHL